MAKDQHPNLFSPLQPVTPSRVAVWPPKPTVRAAEHLTTIANEQSYGQGNGGSTNDIGILTMVIMGIITLGLFVAAIYLGRDIFRSSKSSPGGQLGMATPVSKSLNLNPAVNQRL